MRTHLLIGSAVAAAGLTASLLTAPSALAAAPGDAQAIDLRPIVTNFTDVFDGSAAEIVAHDPSTDRLFVVNAGVGVDVLNGKDLDPEHPASVDRSGLPKVDTISFDDLPDGPSPTGDVNSVDVRDGVLAVAVENDDKVQPGWVAFFDTTSLELLSFVRVGSLPDMLVFTPDGDTVAVANEAEPADDFSSDPEGSVSLIDVSDGVQDLTQGDVRTALFTAFEGEDLPKGVRVFGPDVAVPSGQEPAGRVARNLEPEYVTVEPDSSVAYVALQEASTIAVLDVDAAAFTELLPLQNKDWRPKGRTAGFDASDRDGAVHLSNWPVKGILMPDAISSYQARGRTYLVTANEGDGREWGDYTDAARVKDDEYPLCSGLPASLKEDETLGRLTVSLEDGFDARRGCFREIHTFGGRSFSIFTTDGRLVFDSGSAFEQLIASGEGGVPPEGFNAAHDELPSFDSRSDNKGPEPEGVTVGQVGDRTYAFITLERVGGVMTYDITDPKKAFFVDYVNNRNWDTDAISSRDAGDLGAEGVTFISAEDSPTGQPLVAVANEVSGTTTVFAIETVGSGRSDEPRR